MGPGHLAHLLGWPLVGQKLGGGEALGSRHRWPWLTLEEGSEERTGFSSSHHLCVPHKADDHQPDRAETWGVPMEELTWGMCHCPPPTGLPWAYRTFPHYPGRHRYGWQNQPGLGRKCVLLAVPGWSPPQSDASWQRRALGLSSSSPHPASVPPPADPGWTARPPGPVRLASRMLGCNVPGLARSPRGEGHTKRRRGLG